MGWKSFFLTPTSMAIPSLLGADVLGGNDNRATLFFGYGDASVGMSVLEPRKSTSEH